MPAFLLANHLNTFLFSISAPWVSLRFLVWSGTTGTWVLGPGRPPVFLLWMECSSPPLHSYIEVLTFNVMVSRSGAFGINQVEVRSRGWSPHHGISILIRGGKTRTLPASKRIHPSSVSGTLKTEFLLFKPSNLRQIWSSALPLVRGSLGRCLPHLFLNFLISKNGCKWVISYKSVQVRSHASTHKHT